MSKPGCLLLFTRYPEAGRTKTRLIPVLGAEGAARLQRVLTEKIAVQVNILAKKSGIPTIVCYCGGNKAKMTAWLGPLNYMRQTDGDLGRRMQAAFAHAFTGGAKKAVLIGSDIPEISAVLLAEAFAALDSAKVVLGPSRDGGYYLVGMQAGAAGELYPLLFKNMAWSTPEVFAQTGRRLENAAIPAAILPTLGDIDTPDDLPFARAQGLL
jgi:rSAM/selenodomain-associated transferase 1